MSLRLTQYFLTENNCYKKGRRHSVRGIMVHSTGANNPWLRRYIGPDDGVLGENAARNHWNTPQPGGTSVCVHAFIGKDKAGTVRTYQTLPWEMVGWHSGSGEKGYEKNANNSGYVGFEICEDGLDDAAYFGKVYREAVELCAFLCQKYGLDPARDILCHSEGHQRGIASNHADVMHWFPRFGKNMDLFREEVAAVMAEGKKETPPVAAAESELWRAQIQAHCQFTDPEALFAHVQKFPYGPEWLKKWAQSYPQS